MLNHYQIVTEQIPSNETKLVVEEYLRTANSSTLDLAKCQQPEQSVSKVFQYQNCNNQAAPFESLVDYYSLGEEVFKASCSPGNSNLSDISRDPRLYDMDQSSLGLTVFKTPITAKKDHLTLRALNLCCNRLTTLASSFGQIGKSMLILNLSQNKVSSLIVRLIVSNMLNSMLINC